MSGSSVPFNLSNYAYGGAVYGGAVYGGGVYTKPGPNGTNIAQGAGEREAEYRRLLERSYGVVRESLAQQAIARTATDRTATSGSSILTKGMETLAIGDRIPVVFARRRTGGTGGVLVQPRATEIQVSNTATRITVRWHCVLSDGQIQSVQVRDVRNGFSRQGEFSQNFDKRAGTWLPGNRARQLADTELPSFPLQTGTGGTYAGLTTIEFSNSYPIDSDRWSQAWSVFVRGGLIISRGRLVDDVVGPSDNLCDLLLWALPRSGLLSEDQIDIPTMEAAARFLEANQLHCNAEFSAAQGLPDFLTGILPAFLLRETTVGGRFAVVPLLPVREDGTINTDPLVPDHILTEDVITPDSYSEQPAPAANRGPLRIVATYRQQTSDTEPPLVCSLPLGSAVDVLPPSEEMPLDGFCTSRIHAATAAGYRHATRTLAGGTATVGLRPGSQTGSVLPGQVVQIALRIESEQEQGWISSWWQVARVEMDGDANETLQLSEMPVDAAGRSIVALQVAAARAAAGDLEFPYPVINEEDEPGRETDTSVPPESSPPAPPIDRGDPPLDEGDVRLPPAPPPGAPPGGDDSPVTSGGGGGGAAGLARGGDRTRDPDKGREPVRRRVRWLLAEGQCSRNEAIVQKVVVRRTVNGVMQVVSERGPSLGFMIVTTKLRQLNVTTNNAPVPVNYVIYELHYTPCVRRADGSIRSYGKPVVEPWATYYGGPFDDGNIYGDFDFLITDLGCAATNRINGMP
jgi:hypothetical protein